MVPMFYETAQPNLTLDHLLYKPNALNEAYRQWKEEKRGPLSSIPFGPVAYLRLDEQLDSDLAWKSAKREPGRDPMGLAPNQPNVELVTLECYAGSGPEAKFPDGENSHVFGLVAVLFAQKSRGSVKLRNKDPRENPVVDHNYLAEELDVIVLSEACRFANEIVMKGSGTKSIVKGSWPVNLTHHTFSTREDFVPYVRDITTTCKYHLLFRR